MCQGLQEDKGRGRRDYPSDGRALSSDASVPPRQEEAVPL